MGSCMLPEMQGASCLGSGRWCPATPCSTWVLVKEANAMEESPSLATQDMALMNP